MSGTVYFELMAGGKRLATVSARPIGSISEKFEIPHWAWEVRYTEKPPSRGTLIIPPETDALRIVSMVLESYHAQESYVSETAAT